MPDKPSFVLLSQKLPAETLVPKLIGRIVENVKQPTNGYRPEDPQTHLTHEPIQVTDTDASVYRKSVSDGVAQAQLGQLFGLSAISSETDIAKLEGKTIVTRLLPQHRDAYDAIYAAHKESINKLLKLNGGVGHMIVGLKTICDGTIKIVHEHEERVDGNLKVPAGMIATAASHGTVNLDDTVDPSLSAAKSVTAKWVARNQIVGEQVFAIQYREVVLMKQGGLWKPKKGKVAELKAIHVVEFHDGVYGEDQADEQAKEVIYEDDDSEDDAEEDDSDEGLAAHVSVDEFTRTDVILVPE
jgi:hypothetical protein